ncbi:hypothetical protein ACFLT3_00460 [Chloroflexota bacterium]
MIGLELVGLISVYSSEWDRCLNDWKQMKDNTAEKSSETDEFPEAMMRILQEKLQLASSDLKPEEFWFLSCLTLLRVIEFNNSVVKDNLSELGLSL